VESFDELFKAATVLLEEGAEENQIIPTLALELAPIGGQLFAHGISQRD
jgi:hypothetical protein